MTLYRETPCSHGETFRHWTDGMPQDKWCPGGSREVVTIDYEAAQERMDAMLSYFNPDVSVGEIHIEANPIVDAALHTEKEPASTV